MDGIPPAEAQRSGTVGFAFQAPTLLPWRSAIENVLLPQELLRRGVRDKLSEMDVTITVTSGDGKVLVGKESRDPALAKVARHRTAEQRAIQLASATATTTGGPSITEQLLICPFKAVPFREPATGLCFMRDRWYDPSTGTFLTPDPEGYRDSSNPYIYCAGDPVNVNCSDPTGRHSFVKRQVNGLEFELLAPDPDEVRRGELGMSGSFVNPFTGKRESFSWDQHEAELLLMQARWGNPLIKSAFQPRRDDGG